MTGPQPGSAGRPGAIVVVLVSRSRSISPDRAGQHPAAADELPRDRCLYRLLAAGEAPCEPVEPDRSVEPTDRNLEAGVEFMQVPTQPLLCPCSLGNETVTVIDKHLQLPQHRLIGRG